MAHKVSVELTLKNYVEWNREIELQGLRFGDAAYVLTHGKRMQIWIPRVSDFRSLGPVAEDQPEFVRFEVVENEVKAAMLVAGIGEDSEAFEAELETRLQSRERAYPDGANSVFAADYK